MTNVRNSDSRMNRQTARALMIGDKEFQSALDKAAQTKNEFLRLRALAVLSLLRLTGKRRGEIAIIPYENFVLERQNLNVIFILEKKRKKKLIQKLATKSLPLADPLTQNIISYLDYLSQQKPKPKFWLPHAKSIFGTVMILPSTHIGGRQVFNIVQNTSETIWPHLFRETAASDVTKQDNSIARALNEETVNVRTNGKTPLRRTYAADETEPVFACVSLARCIA